MYISSVEIYLLFNRSCTKNDFKLFTLCLCRLCAIILLATCCPNYAQCMTRYHTELIYSDKAHPAACAMLETGAMSIRRTNKVSKGAKIRNGYNQAPYLTQGTNGKVTTSQLDITNENQEANPFPEGDHKASINRREKSITKQDRTNVNDPQKMQGKPRLGA